MNLYELGDGHLEDTSDYLTLPTWLRFDGFVKKVEPNLDAAMDAWFFLAGQGFKLQLAGALNAYIRGPITETPCDCDELIPGICDGGPHRIKRGIQGKESV